MTTAVQRAHDHPPGSHAIGSPGIALADDFQRKFVCPEESSRYAGSLEQLVFNRLRDQPNPTVIEFGSGTGSPVIAAILNSGFSGCVHGYEISPDAAEAATQAIEQNGLGRNYVVYNESFFDSIGIPQSDYLIANPPYVPSDNSELLTLPGLHGGSEGNDISKKLLSSGYKNVFLEVSSYSNPVGLINHALSLGYKMTDFQVTQMPFGIYSRQDIVQERINEMREAGKAFFSDRCYLVGSAFFTKNLTSEPDLSQEFLACLTSLGRTKISPAP